MFHITKTKDGKQFYGVNIGNNYEVLCQTEPETRKANIIKNIYAQVKSLKMSAKEDAYFQDDTGRKPKVFYLDMSGTATASALDTEPVYVPKSKRRVRK